MKYTQYISDTISSLLRCVGTLQKPPSWVCKTESWAGHMPCWCCMCRRIWGWIKQTPSDRSGLVLAWDWSLSSKHSLLQTVWTGGPSKAPAGELDSWEWRLCQKEIIKAAQQEATEDPPPSGGICEYVVHEEWSPDPGHMEALHPTTTKWNLRCRLPLDKADQTLCITGMLCCETGHSFSQRRNNHTSEAAPAAAWHRECEASQLSHLVRQNTLFPC